MNETLKTHEYETEHYENQFKPRIDHQKKIGIYNFD